MRPLCAQLDTPTLVLHAVGDAMIPFENGRMLAALIPRAQFAPLESRNHVLMENEPAWSRFLAEIRAFLGAADPEPVVGAQPPRHAPGNPGESGRD